MPSPTTPCPAVSELIDLSREQLERAIGQLKEKPGEAARNAAGAVECIDGIMKRAAGRLLEFGARQGTAEPQREFAAEQLGLSQQQVNLGLGDLKAPEQQAAAIGTAVARFEAAVKLMVSALSHLEKASQGGVHVRGERPQQPAVRVDHEARQRQALDLIVSNWTGPEQRKTAAAELAKLFGVSESHATRVVAPLMESGVIVNEAPGQKGGGGYRPSDTHLASLSSSPESSPQPTASASASAQTNSSEPSA